MGNVVPGRDFNRLLFFLVFQLRRADVDVPVGDGLMGGDDGVWERNGHAPFDNDVICRWLFAPLPVSESDDGNAKSRSRQTRQFPLGAKKFNGISYYYLTLK